MKRPPTSSVIPIVAILLLTSALAKEAHAYTEWTLPGGVPETGAFLPYGDVDGDGDLDIVVQFNPTVKIIDLKTGNVVFDEPITSPTSTPLSHVALVDVDGDGISELLCSFSSEWTKVAFLSAPPKSETREVRR